MPPAVPIEDIRTEAAEDDADILPFGGVRRVEDILAQSDPTRDEKDDDGCFEIDSGEDLEALVSEALAKSKLHRAVAAQPATTPPARRDLDDDPLARIRR